MLKNFLIFTFLVLILGSVNATFVDSLETESDCFIPAEELFDFTNTSSQTQTYVIEAEGKEGEWINLEGHWIGRGEPLKFSLASGKTEGLWAFIKPDCRTLPGNYEINLIIHEGSKKISQKIDFEVLESRVLKITPVKDELNTGQCSEAQFSFNVRNISKADELISIEIENLPGEWYNLNSKEFFLKKGGLKKIELDVAVPCGRSAGEYEFDVLARIKGTEFFVIKPFTLNLLDNQKISISSVSQQEMCSEKKHEQIFTVKNLGEETDELELSLTGPDWLSLKETSFSLERGESKEITLFVDDSRKTGNYDFSVRAYSTKFNKTTTKQMKINTALCNALRLDSSDLDRQIEVEAGKEKVYTLKISNLGTKENNVKVSVSGLDWVYFNPKEFTVQPNTTEEFFLYFAPVIDQEEGTYEATLNASGTNFSQNIPIQVTSFGGTNALTKGTSLDAESKVNEVKTVGDRIVLADVSFVNNGETILEMQNITAENFDTEFEFTEQTLKPGESTTIPTTIYLKEEFEETLFRIPLKIETQIGMLEKELEINLEEKTVTPVGLFSFGEISKDFIIGALVLIIIALIFYTQTIGKKTPILDIRSAQEKNMGNEKNSETNESFENNDEIIDIRSKDEKDSNPLNLGKNVNIKNSEDESRK